MNNLIVTVLVKLVCETELATSDACTACSLQMRPIDNSFHAMAAKPWLAQLRSGWRDGWRRGHVAGLHSAADLQPDRR